MKVYTVSARPLGWGGGATASSSLLIVAASADAAREQAVLVWKSQGRDWWIAPEGAEDAYTAGRGERTPDMMWLTVNEVDWSASYFQAGSLRKFIIAWQIAGAS